MKNIHIIPTNKPSKLYKSKITQDIFTSDNMSQHGDATYNVNIYITSDEEIKEGDWCFGMDGIFQYKGVVNIPDIELPKKIILTTDQDLIADGVQAIDDEFLEWFVKNPSCEGVEFQRWYDGYKFGYKIIIPQEESNKTHHLDELPNMDKDVVLKMYNAAIPKLKPKQETLEQAAERIYLSHENNDLLYGHSEDLQLAYKAGVLDGAKWQAERMEEILRKAYFDRTDDIDVDGYWISDPEKDLEMLIEQFKKK
jgi:hypothetical protein